MGLVSHTSNSRKNISFNYVTIIQIGMKGIDACHRKWYQVHIIDKRKKKVISSLCLDGRCSCFVQTCVSCVKGTDLDDAIPVKNLLRRLNYTCQTSREGLNGLIPNGVVVENNELLKVQQSAKEVGFSPHYSL